jgi:hypothetical protein
MATAPARPARREIIMSIASIANRSIWVLGALLVGAWAAQPGIRLTAAQPPTTRPIVVAELFTSEGCSSCPPADAVLSQLVLGQPVEGAEVLALGEHVDYWDQLGWRDPFSSALYSRRQSNYDAQVFHRHELYTPQFVVDGRLERVGSDIGAVHRAIKQAAQAPKAAVDVAAVRADDRDLHVEVHVTVPTSLTLRESADVLVAIAEDNLVTEVRRGENGGRTLRHSAVVRSLTTVGTLSAHEHTWSTSASLPVAQEWKPANLRIVSFLQERASRRIVGAGSAPRGGFQAAGVRSSAPPAF